MLSLDAKRSARNYALVNGMYNGVWITGYVRNIDKDRGLFYIQQTNNQSRMLPIHCDANTRLPANVRETHPIHVIAHAEGIFDPNKNERSVRIRAIGFERPSLMTLSPDAAWNAIIKPGASAEEFKPVQGLSGRLNASSNIVKLAGFLHGSILTRDENPTLIILIRQHEDDSRTIPVRITGRFAKPLKEKLKKGMPLSIQGQYAIKVIERADGQNEGGENLLLDKIPYIHATNIGAATSDEITIVPQWARRVQDSDEREISTTKKNKHEEELVTSDDIAGM